MILKVTDILKQVFVYIVTNIIIDLDNFIVAEILVLYKSTIVIIVQVPSAEDAILEFN